MEYCYKCGKKLVQKECFNCGISEGIVPYCENCGEFIFPIFNTAVSTVIYNPDRTKILLVRQYGRDWNILVAGYVTKGESLEEALVREIKEETDLDIECFMYNESQYFERSNTLICNFIAVVKDEKFNCNSEIDYAQWYPIEEAKKAVFQIGLAVYFLNKSLEKIQYLDYAQLSRKKAIKKLVSLLSEK